MDAETRRWVRVRAEHRCEYCRLPQSAAEFLTFHVEHVEARQHVLDDGPENLALACPDCNRFKGPNLTTLDSETREIIRIFHPRKDNWSEHFAMEDARIVGRTAIGIATERLLRMNSEERLEVRLELLKSELW